MYHVQLMNALTGTEAGTFASGKLTLRSETDSLKPVKIEVIDPEEKLVQMTLYEGRYHQIRRMLAAVKNKAVSIHRVQVGPLSLKDLPIGHWRMLSSQEIESVWKQGLPSVPTNYSVPPEAATSPAASAIAETPAQPKKPRILNLMTKAASVSKVAEAKQQPATARRSKLLNPLPKSAAEIRKTRKKMQNLKEKHDAKEFKRRNSALKNEMPEEEIQDPEQVLRAQKRAEEAAEKPSKGRERRPSTGKRN